jgi:FkbM family methyltransferase
MAWISYAQNFEDVILMRALDHVSEGLYIDVGAQHPLIDSVSRAFYEKGWRGIHVEPVPVYAEALRQNRPEEIVVQAMLGRCKERTNFYEIPDTGLSTAVQKIALEHAAYGFSIVKTEVEQTTLAVVLELAGQRPIHWLKIDVEGNELLVLRGWLHHRARPWIVVVESTLPLSKNPSYAAWEPCLLRRGYRFVYFDGLNRFYLHRDHRDIKCAFDHGPCVFDGFALSGLASAPFCVTAKGRAQATATDGFDNNNLPKE